MEPIAVARKPFRGTVAGNVAEHGVGALNIDRCRVPTTDVITLHGNPGLPGGSYGNGRAGEASAERRYEERGATDFAATPGPRGGDERGRWPANVVHDGSDEVVTAFPDAPGQQGNLSGQSADRPEGRCLGAMPAAREFEARGDTGSAARFYYAAKASSEERGRGNNHPTVKPLALMRWLCGLVTPPGGTVLDPFCGSGTTGVAAITDGFSFVGVELNAPYVDIARRRINDVAPLFFRTALGGESK